jgi:hypothetical protein
MIARIRLKTSEEREAERAAAEAVRAKVRELATEYSELLARMQTNWAAMQDALAAARLFNAEIDLPPDYPATAPSTHPMPPIGSSTVPAQPSLFERAGDTTIREAVLDELEKAGERGTKAAAIRRAIEDKIGRQLHYKTVGMTLYRLSERGQARREGYTWFITPEGVRTKTPAS